MTTEEAKLSVRPPPARVLWFERLFYCSAFLSFVRIIIDWSNAMRPVTFGALYVLAIAQIILIWLASRRRKNWARWLLLFLFLAWAATSLLRAGFGERSESQPQAVASQVLKVVQLVLEDVGLILVFTGNAHRWFKPHMPRHSNAVR